MGAARWEEEEEGGERPRSWYVSREEIERDSPSRRDGVGAAKEAELRATYSSFIRDVCIRLHLPQITIATAILLCHRFYLRQSHAKNEWQTVATVCVFLASKIEDTPCLLKHVVIVAYETMYRKNPDAAKRICQEEVLAKQKALILVGETLLLSTIRFDFNIQHPYEPLKLALKDLGISQNEVRQVAMGLINDTLPTTLVVQFKPHYIAAGALFLAAKFCNVILPSQNGKVWWHRFDVAPKQLQEVMQQMNELFKKRDPCSMGPVIKPVPTPTLMDKQQIKPTTIPTLMDKQQIKPTPTPTLMDKQQIKPTPTPTLTDRHQIISAPDPALRHTQSSRRRFSNSNTEASRCAPVGCSFDKSTSRSARNEDNQYRRTNEDNQYRRKNEDNQYRRKNEDNQYWRTNEDNQYRRTNEDNQHRRTHKKHNLDVPVDQRLEEQSYLGPLKADRGYHVRSGLIDMNATIVMDLTRQKRRIQDVGRLYLSDANDWRIGPLKKQKLERR